MKTKARRTPNIIYPFFLLLMALFVGLASASYASEAVVESTGEAPVLVSEHALPGNDFRLTQVTLWDRTDGHDELVRIQTPDIKTNEQKTFTCGIFVVEETTDERGWVFIRRSPMPVSRPIKPDVDIELSKAQDHLAVKLYRADYESEEDLWQVLEFHGGEFERIKALQAWQRSLRPDSDLFRIPTFIVNTWGDRSRDSRISEEFILKEIEAAKELGVDVVRIDDGWQRGLSGNSAFKGEMKTEGLTGFWGVSDSFWSVNPERFPNGLEPVLAKAKEAGVEIGLWYAPDSDNELANWEKDAETLLALHKTYGIRHFKLDGLDVTTPLAQKRVHQLLESVREESNGEILPMLDITGGHKRPGFLGAIPDGNLFVQNRYTDWGKYWPHRTLRSLWRLSHWVDPLRLRFETLNNTRNTEHKAYKDNPLAPAHYPSDYLFASVMVSNPLGWYEVSNLPTEYSSRLAPLVDAWREHREDLFASSIIPIGQEPSGHSWTGFLTLDKSGNPNYLLFLKEFSDAGTFTYQLPVALDPNSKLRTLHGAGTAKGDGKNVTVTIEDQPGYLWLAVE